VKSEPLLSIIIVNWNTSDLLAACLASIHQHLTVPNEVIVVDNGSEDDSVRMTKDRFPSAQVIPQRRNLGFSRANNIGLAAANGTYLLLLNPDTKVRPGALEALLRFYDRHPQAGIVGPTLLYPNGEQQASVAPFPTLWVEFLRQTGLHRLVPTRAFSASRQDRTQEVETVTGAALCIRRSCFEQIGGLDERIFLFYEDADWCKRAHDAGWQVWFVKSPGIVHVKAASSARFARRRTLLDSQRSAVYYFSKHRGDRAVRGLRWVTLCGALVRLTRAWSLWVLLANDRADQRQRAGAYLQMLRWSLTGRGLEH
jgi:GT2 family glycosyltransferase